MLDLIRTHASLEPLPAVLVKKAQRVFMKPTGLWYSINGDWERWCKEQEFGLQEGEGFRYEVTIDTSRILTIGDHGVVTMDFDEFDMEYGSNKDEYNGIRMAIDWSRVAEKYDGVEIPVYSYRQRCRLMWYYGWDVASGCIWDPACIRSITKLSQVGA